MPTSFTVTIANRQFDFLSMNVKEPVLFQVFTVVDGKRKRYHMQERKGKLQFLLPDEIPADILEHEDQLAYEAKVNWAL